MYEINIRDLIADMTICFAILTFSVDEETENGIVIKTDFYL